MIYLLVILGIVLAFVLFLKLMEKRMIYFPTRSLDWTPEQSGMPFEDLRLHCTDGVTIHGWFIPAEGPRATILFFHGNAGNISHRSDKLQIFHDLKLNVCIIDYHGFGQSEGEPGEKETYLDADVAYGWLTQQKKIAPKQIIVWGESLGGGIATHLAARSEVGGLVLESTYTTLPDVGRAAFPFLPTKLIMATQYDSIGRIKRIHVPLLSLHSPSDEVIPYRLGKRLFDAANEPKTFVDLKGDHNGGFLISGKKFANAIGEFLERYFPR
ncbi:MAG: alpha/beta hydrolase [Verrucomicrobiae bacterium]|nr:alpha/beta hydrolase [Verrucomicrobiae bacterium]